jgi:hypothetical protein
MFTTVQFCGPAATTVNLIRHEAQHCDISIHMYAIINMLHLSMNSLWKTVTATMGNSALAHHLHFVQQGTCTSRAVAAIAAAAAARLTEQSAY